MVIYFQGFFGKSGSTIPSYHGNSPRTPDCGIVSSLADRQICFTEPTPDPADLLWQINPHSQASGRLRTEWTKAKIANGIRTGSHRLCGKKPPCTEQVQLTRYTKDNLATPVLPHGHSLQCLQTFRLSSIALGCVKHWWMNFPMWASCSPSQPHLQGMVSDSRPAFFGHPQPHLPASTTCTHLPHHLQQLRWWRYDCCTPQGLHTTTSGKNDQEPIK